MTGTPPPVRIAIYDLDRTVLRTPTFTLFLLWAAARVALGHLADRVTHRLSGGEKRLVTLATVLAMDPDVLLLDEPTNALDEDAAARLTAVLLGLPQAMVIVSHDRAFRTRLATRTATLKEGRIR